MAKYFTIILGKAIQRAARLRGGGSALPGLFVEKISPSFIADTLAKIPRGVVVISGTNGKTTTTKMVVSLLEDQGLKVFTNRTGSNFVRGVAAALLSEVDINGDLTADIAVLELDEAHAVKFVDLIKPSYSLLLNVMRDQLDRFGEIDSTAIMLQKIACATTNTVVLNREDNRIAPIADKTPNNTTIKFFGLSQDLLRHFPTDDNLHTQEVSSIVNQNQSSKNNNSRSSSHKLPKASVVLDSFDGNTASFMIGDQQISTKLQVKGVYNIFNAAAALALVSAILPTASPKELGASIAKVTPAFGRGEQLIIGGQALELVLVKNPSGFRLSLASFQPKGTTTMIAINDNYADGRDMSWLWDVDFTSLTETPVYVTGIRAYDMALRLQYEEVAVLDVEPDLSLALRKLIAQNPNKPKRIYCTYTAMLELRKELSKITKVETIS